MGITEIVLIIIGVTVFVASFLLPGKYLKKEVNTKEWEDKVEQFLQQQVKTAEGGLEEKTDEVFSASAEKAERCMERLANEKIMAVQEYSDTVLEQIHRNHEEAVFLYDMLNSKHNQIKFTAGEISTAMEKAKGNLENTARDVLQDILPNIINEEVERRVQNMTLPASAKEVLAKADSVKEEPKEEILPQTTQDVGEEEGFQELMLTAPEVIMQEEQPFVVQSIKRVESKRKGSEQKSNAQAVQPIDTQVEAEDLPETEKDLNGNNKEKILQLHKEGKSQVDIARELGLGVGEVKLVIGLFDGA